MKTVTVKQKPKDDVPVKKLNVPQSMEEILKSDDIARVKMILMGLQKPITPLQSYMNKLGEIYKVDTNDLEKWMGIFVQWENYYRETAEIYDAVRTIADSHLSYYWGLAVLGSDGTINEKKEVAKANTHYIKARETYITANTHYKLIMMKAENCERGYRLVSRIIGKRINIKEY